MFTRPLVLLANVAAICAKRPGATNPGRTAIRRLTVLVLASSPVAVVHVSAKGASEANRPLANLVGIRR